MEAARELAFSLERPEDLGPAARAAMLSLMRASYDGVTPERFEADLAWKDIVILLRDEEGTIRGFSTVAYNPRGCGGGEYNVIFSGDTIIDPEHWGSPALSQGFRATLGGLKGAGCPKPLYWVLISKGYRTYLYMPLYFKRFHPCVEADRSEDLRHVADACARTLFPAAWNPQDGILRFGGQHDRLKPALAEVAEGKGRNPHIRYFLERNPGFTRGHELACVARVEEGNLLRPDPRWFGTSQADPSPLFREIAARKARRAA